VIRRNRKITKGWPTNEDQSADLSKIGSVLLVPRWNQRHEFGNGHAQDLDKSTQASAAGGRLLFRFRRYRPLFLGSSQPARIKAPKPGKYCGA
jgi:hypothetical protein